MSIFLDMRAQIFDCFCALTEPKFLEQCLVYSRCSINTVELTDIIWVFFRSI